MVDRMFPIPVLRNKNRCPHLSIHLECNAGGFGHANCFHHDYHSNCHYRQKAERKYQDEKKEENTAG